MAGIFSFASHPKVYVFNTVEKLLNTANPRVHSDTSRCLTMGVYALNNGFAPFNSFPKAEVACFPVFRFFQAPKCKKRSEKASKRD
jgi:hypothetical protein